MKRKDRKETKKNSTIFTNDLLEVRELVSITRIDWRYLRYTCCLIPENTFWLIGTRYGFSSLYLAL
jgi:hypothetical protein